MSEFLDFAQELARVAADEIMPKFRGTFTTETKPDKTVVTDADRGAEAAMRALIAERYPAHGILGEEHGNERISAEYCWVLDPIDGTTSFVHGVPLFSGAI